MSNTAIIKGVMMNTRTCSRQVLLVIRLATVAAIFSLFIGCDGDSGKVDKDASSGNEAGAPTRYDANTTDYSSEHSRLDSPSDPAIDNGGSDFAVEVDAPIDAMGAKDSESGFDLPFDNESDTPQLLLPDVGIGEIQGMGGVGGGGTSGSGGAQGSGGAMVLDASIDSNGTVGTGGSMAGIDASATEVSSDASVNTGGISGTGGMTGTGGVTMTGIGGSIGSGGAAGGGTGSTHWVGTWTGAPQKTNTENLPPSPLSNAILRQIVHVSLGGSQIRVQFSNIHGNGPLTINKAHAAVCKATGLVDSTIDTTTDKALLFAGKESVTIDSGNAAWSDALVFDLKPLSNLTVTTAFASVPSNVTGHPGSRTTSYEQTNSSNVSAASMTSATKMDHWYILSGIDVMADDSAKSVVIIGDSITDGRGSTTNGNDRWPDILAKRLQANAATANVSIMNQGIGANAVTSDSEVGGDSAQKRFSRDALGPSGVRWIIVFEGVNDIGGGISSSSLTSAYDDFIQKAHAKNLLIYGATITPFGGNPQYYSSSHENTRQAVNTYIKSGKFDGYLDMDAALSDGGNPPKLKSEYNFEDGLHTNVAGHQKMGESVDLTLFTR
jgi:lysophospholipase L1-like esterase